MTFYTYILFSTSLQQYYTGSTSDVNKRVNDHNKGWSKHTSKGIPWTLVYSVTFESRTQALQKENNIKKEEPNDFSKV